MNAEEVIQYGDLCFVAAHLAYVNAMKRANDADIAAWQARHSFWKDQFFAAADDLQRLKEKLG